LGGAVSYPGVLVNDARRIHRVTFVTGRPGQGE
jgi:hypothetical protein